MTEGFRAVITDIEGTVAPISFVADCLFPFARENLPRFLHQRAAEPEIAEALQQVATRIGIPDLPFDLAVAKLLRWMDEDRKETSLKTLQGLIWAEGYAAGHLKATLYPDVIPQLRQWRSSGFQLYVYSSGSVTAQKLLFAHTDEGDVTGLFDDFFDTRVGAKIAPESYVAILDRIALPAGSVLFLSDSERELDAAASIGIVTRLLARPDSPAGEVPAGRHEVHRDLTSVLATSEIH